ncbi:MAG: spherulation-specific family 4 protein [Actinomycetota bacterium]
MSRTMRRPGSRAATNTAPAPAAGAGWDGAPRAPLALGVPAYFSPVRESGEWTRLAAAPPGTVIIVNPDSGPDPGMRGDYAAAVAASRRRGCLVYGYVDTAYGARDARAVVADAHAYRFDLGVDGVFLDRAGCDREALAGLESVARSVRPWGLRVAVNPGHPQVPAEVLDMFEEVVLFEGPLDMYADLPERGDVDTRPRPGRRWHLVYGVRSASVMAAVLTVASWRGADVVYVTDGHLPNPWEALPDYWDRQVDAVSRTAPTPVLP